jgi:cell wall-associated NlpC family hydrolase
VLSGTVFPLISPSQSAGASQVSDLQAKAAQLEQQISAEGNQIGALGERFDEAEDQINSLNNQIGNTKDQIATDQKRVAGDQANLRRVAINSYISDGSVALSNPLFSSNQQTFSAQQEYNQVATGNLGVAVANLHTAQVQLNAAEANLDTQDQQAHSAADAASQAEATANQQQAALNADLGQVKGQLGALVLQEQEAAQNAESSATQAVLVDGANFPPPPSAGSAAGAAVQAAESQLGVPYVWGGTSPRGTPGDPSGGFDCSGLVMWAWGQAGVGLPHYSGSQFDDTAPVPVSDMEPGDILFYGAGGSQHEAMYVGGGEMIEAPETGEVVHITPIRLGDGFAGVHRP